MIIKGLGFSDSLGRVEANRTQVPTPGAPVGPTAPDVLPRDTAFLSSGNKDSEWKPPTFQSMRNVVYPTDTTSSQAPTGASVEVALQPPLTAEVALDSQTARFYAVPPMDASPYAGPPMGASSNPGGPQSGGESSEGGEGPNWLEFLAGLLGGDAAPTLPLLEGTLILAKGIRTVRPYAERIHEFSRGEVGDRAWDFTQDP